MKIEAYFIFSNNAKVKPKVSSCIVISALHNIIPTMFEQFHHENGQPSSSGLLSFTTKSMQ